MTIRGSVDSEYCFGPAEHIAGAEGLGHDAADTGSVQGCVLRPGALQDCFQQLGEGLRAYRTGP